MVKRAVGVLVTRLLLVRLKIGRVLATRGLIAVVILTCLSLMFSTTGSTLLYKFGRPTGFSQVGLRIGVLGRLGGDGGQV